MQNKNTLPFVIVIAVIVAVLWFVFAGDEQHHGLDIQTWQTKNGAKVYYVQAPDLPIVDVQVVFNAGSVRDGKLPGLAGFTNLLLDHGAGDWDTNQIKEQLDDVGAKLTTSSLRDMALVGLRSLSDEALLTPALDVMAAVLQKPVFNEAEIDRERQGLLVSLQAQLESPATQAELAFFKAVYADHPYQSPSNGTKESISAITRQDVLDFYKQYYVANNAIVAVVGNVDKQQAMAIVDKLVGQLPQGQKPAAVPAVAPLEKAQTVKKEFASQQTHIWVGQPGLKRGDKDFFPLYVGNHILGGSGFSSRILTTIRSKNALAYSSYSRFLPMQQLGPFVMALQTKNDQADKALALLQKVLDDFIKDGPTEAELEHAKKNITGGFALKIDSNKDIMSYVAMMAFYDLPLDYLSTFNEKVNAVTIDDIKNAFARRIKPQTMATIMVGQLSVADQPQQDKTAEK